MKKGLLDMMRKGVLILDGAMGTNLQRLLPDRSAFGDKGLCNEYLNLCAPETVLAVHSSFLAVGCQGIETNTFGASRIKLSEFGLQDRVREINVQAARLALRAARSSGRDAYVFGSIGPTGMLPSSEDPALGGIGFEELVEVFSEQAAALLEGGVDALLVETSQDILEAKAAVAGCRRAMAGTSRVPLVVQVTLDRTGKMLMGTDIGAAMVTLEGMEVDGVGINCSTGPEEMRDSIRFLSAHCSLPVSCLPNMGIPVETEGEAHYPLGPGDFAAVMKSFVEDLGVSVVGGCCGSTPEHLAALVEKLRGVSPAPRRRRPLRAIASAMTYLPLEQEPRPLLVGERVNAQGSRRTKELLLADDIEGVMDVARKQAEGGAHALDVCVALNEREDEKSRFLRVAKKLALTVPAPIFVDSTDVEVIAAAIANYPGRVVVNSVNLEAGEGKIRVLAPAIKTFGAYVIALTIDEKGMAQTCQRKVEVASRIANTFEGEFGLGAERLIFDPLTFTLATGEEAYRKSALETLSALEEIKRQIPGSLTILGVSNVSFGLPRAARAVLNSVFLFHGLEKGLDMAIVNPADIMPYPEIEPQARRLAEDLIFARKARALEALLAHFEGKKRDEARKPGKALASVEEEIGHRIVNRQGRGIEELIDRAVAERDAVEVLNQVLLPAMKQVGDKFGRGELILPFVLQSAEVMKTAVAALEKYLEKKEGYHKGKVVLATVFGDVHDIGKNLVKTILSNNGYLVKDLGKQVPAGRIVEETKRMGADLVGLSALLVSTSQQMPVVVRELHREGLQVPVIIGGAAVTARFARKAALLEEGTPYPGGVFYARDVFEALSLAERLLDEKGRRELLEGYRKSMQAPSAELPRRRPQRGGLVSLPRVEPPPPPFWGIRQLDRIDLEEVYACMDLRSLYRLSWGIRHLSSDEYEMLLSSKFEPLRMKLQEEAKEKGYLNPRAVYGFFPCRSSGQRLVVFDPEEREREVASFLFPRQEGKKGLSLADYFRSDREDVVALQLVTMGEEAGRRCRELSDLRRYTDSYLLHGLSVEAAEGLAEWLHRRIRREWGLEEARGKRYSHGYPACPDLAENRIILRLLEGKKRLGVRLTEGCQFVPEQTTGAIVVHHPQAEYFAV